MYFDNLQVTQAHGRIIEEDHYYAYGLKIAAISSRKLGDVNEGYLKNNNLYQGDFSELDEDIGWNDFELRNYDPQIGRWVQHDPFDEFASPYLGMGNDPVNNVDPNGGSAMTALAGGTGLLIAGTTIVGAMVGAVAGAKQGGVKGALEGGLIGAAVGLLASVGDVGKIVGRVAVGSADILVNVVDQGKQNEVSVPVLKGNDSPQSDQQMDEIEKTGRQLIKNQDYLEAINYILKSYLTEMGPTLRGHIFDAAAKGLAHITTPIPGQNGQQQGSYTSYSTYILNLLTRNIISWGAEVRMVYHEREHMRQLSNYSYVEDGFEREFLAYQAHLFNKVLPKFDLKFKGERALFKKWGESINYNYTHMPLNKQIAYGPVYKSMINYINSYLKK